VSFETKLPSPTVLLVITVYNGRAVVPQAIRSAMRLSQVGCSIDVLVLDDCSPDPGWSDELDLLCGDAGVMYYRSPRNLGIPRNCNLGLLAAADGGYDYVILCNSDVIFPADMVSQLISVARTDPRIGSVTAWSNHASVYSLPNEDSDQYLTDQQVIDWATQSLTGEFGADAIDIPTGVGFCLLIPVDVLRVVGLMDPVFGRGYSEEVDWCLRSQALGYRITLAPSVFVYHRGQGSNVEAGLLAHGETNIPAHDAIVSMRYPSFLSQVGRFMASDLLSVAYDRAFRALIGDAARQRGYVLQLSWMGSASPPGDVVRVVVDPRGRAPVLELSYLGFRWRVGLEGRPLVAELRDLLGGDPIQVVVPEPSDRALALASDLAEEGIPVHHGMSYPQRV
jgi:GT2 family glycosyltransferase